MNKSAPESSSTNTSLYKDYKHLNGCFLANPLPEFMNWNKSVVKEMASELYFKISATLILLFAVTLFIISKEEELLVLEDESFEKALQKFKRSIHWNSTDRIETWELIGRSNRNLSYEDKLKAVKSKNFPPGNMGKPVELKSNLRGLIKTLISKGWLEHAYNQFVGDLIPIDRLLPDMRDKGCLKSYTKVMPQASVVITFYNEALSTLLRTIHSVLNRSPEHLLKEVILVDDYSSMSHLKHLGDYVRELPKVSLIRAFRREGLIRARILGIKHVNAPVIIFLDSHCECSAGWLEPLLDRIAEDPTIVASPVIDHIDKTTFEYIPQDINALLVGGFNWELEFLWRPLAKSSMFKGNQSPVHTPTIAGGLFAIDKTFFETLGFYDEGFETWGAENLELSFKTWMCGGSLEIVPCSHVGHIFRKSFPHGRESGSLKRNLLRLAEVWLDDYAKYFHERIGYQLEDIGDVSKQKELRRKLNCKSFRWYLRNIYPELDVPENAIRRGQIQNMGDYEMCLDSTASAEYPVGTVHPMHCHHHGQNQFWLYTYDQKVKQDDRCLDFMFNLVLLMDCGDRAQTQIWFYNNKTKHLRHKQTQDCLKVARFNDDIRIILQECVDEDNQKWNIGSVTN